MLVASVLAGCGGKKDDSASLQELVKQSQTKMSDIKSAAFDSAIDVKIDLDEAKLGEKDKAQADMLAKGVSLKLKGSAQTSPVLFDMNMTADAIGQTFSADLRANTKKLWLNYMGSWYVMALPPELAAQMNDAGEKQLTAKDFGIDTSTWGITYELVGEETVNNVKVKHIKATADAQKVADSIFAAVETPEFAKQVGEKQTKELKKTIADNKARIDEIKKAVKDVQVEYWIGIDDQLTYKMAFSAGVVLEGMKDVPAGLKGLTLTGSLDYSKFNEPVKVVPPKGAKPFEKMMSGAGL